MCLDISNQKYDSPDIVSSTPVYSFVYWGKIAVFVNFGTTVVYGTPETNMRDHIGGGMVWMIALSVVDSRFIPRSS